MTNDSIGARNIDDAIDRAIRDMVQIDPLPGLRFRVLARLERPPRGGGSGWLRSLAFLRGSWQPVAALAVVAIALAVVVPRFMRESTPAPATRGATTANVPSAAPSAPPAPAVPSATTPSGQPTAAARARTRAAEPTPESIFGPKSGRVTAATGDVFDDPAAVEPAYGPPDTTRPTLRPLAPLQPLAITPITVAPISVRPIGQR